MPRAAPTASKPNSSSSSSPPKSTPSSPGIRKLRQEWKKSLKPWTPDPQREFRHPIGTRTVTKTDAKNGFKLDAHDIASLPCQIQQRPGRTPAYLYNYDQLIELATRKCAKLGRPVEGAASGMDHGSHTGSSQTGEVPVVSFMKPPKLEAWQEHMLHPMPPPLKILEYTFPPNALKPDPKKITWAPSKISGPVSIEDACRLYCINPEDIQDLAQHSHWIDLPTVAKRAVTLHGGFYAHAEFVLQRRNVEEDMLAREISEAYKRKSQFRFSSMVQKQWEAEAPSEGYFLYASRLDRVAVLYPIEYHCSDDYGCDWEWLPAWGDF